MPNACEETHLQPALENKTLDDINNTTQMFMELAGKNFEHSHDGGRDPNDILQLTNSSHGPLQASAIKSPPHNAHNTLVPRDSSREVAQDTSPQKYHTIDTTENKDRNV